MQRLISTPPPALTRRPWSTEQFQLLRRMTRGVLWTVTGQAALRASAFLTTIAVARLLGTTEFGELALVQSSAAMFGVLAGFGLGPTTTRYVAYYQQSDRERTCDVLFITTVTAAAISGFLALMVVLASDWIAQTLLAQPELSFALKASSLLFVVCTLDGIAVAALRGFESFGRLATVNLVRAVLTPIIAVPLVYVWAVHGAIAASILSGAVGLVLTLQMVRKQCKAACVPVRFRVAPWHEWRILWKFSLPSMLATALVIPPAWFGQALLARQPDGFRQLGFYTVANQWLTLVLFFPSVLGAVLMPIIASSRTSNATRASSLFAIPILMSAAVGLVLSSVSILAAEPILELYGEDFAAAKAVYIVMMIAAVLSAVNEILQQALLGMGAPLVRLGTSTLRAGVFVGSALVLVPVSLGLGLALSRLAAASVYLVVQLPLYCYRIRTTQYE